MKKLKCLVEIESGDVALKVLVMELTEDFERGARLRIEGSGGPPFYAKKLSPARNVERAFAEAHADFVNSVCMEHDDITTALRRTHFSLPVAKLNTQP